MAKIKRVGPSCRIAVASGYVTVATGDTVDVPADVAKELTDSDLWSVPIVKKAKAKTVRKETK